MFDHNIFTVHYRNLLSFLGLCLNKLLKVRTTISEIVAVTKDPWKILLTKRSLLTPCFHSVPPPTAPIISGGKEYYNEVRPRCWENMQTHFSVHNALITAVLVWIEHFTHQIINWFLCPGRHHPPDLHLQHVPASSQARVDRQQPASEGRSPADMRAMMDNIANGGYNTLGSPIF